MDYQALLLDPIYDRLGVAAELTIGSADPVDLTVIDKTAGVNVGDQVEVQTIRPVAAVREAELDEHEIAAEDLRGGSISFNGGSWQVHSFQRKPVPEGPGEIWLILKA